MLPAGEPEPRYSAAASGLPLASVPPVARIVPFGSTVVAAPLRAIVRVVSLTNTPGALSEDWATTTAIRAEAIARREKDHRGERNLDIYPSDRIGK